MRRVRTLRERTFSQAPGCCAFTLLRGQKGQVFLALSEANTGRLDLYCWDGGDWVQLRSLPGLQLMEPGDASISPFPVQLNFEDPLHGQLVLTAFSAEAQRGVLGRGYMLLAVNYDGSLAARAPLPDCIGPPFISRFPNGNFLKCAGPRDVYRLSEQGEIRWHYRHRAWRKTVDEPGALFNAMAMPNERTAIFLHSAGTGSAQVMELDRDGRLAEKSSWMAATREPPVFLPVPEGFWAETWLPAMDCPEETSFQRLHISNAGSLLERQEIRVSAGHPPDRACFTEESGLFHVPFTSELVRCSFDGRAQVRYLYPSAGASGIAGNVPLISQGERGIIAMSGFTGHSGNFSIFGFLPDGQADWTIRRKWCCKGNRRMAASGGQLFLACSTSHEEMTVTAFQLPT